MYRPMEDALTQASGSRRLSENRELERISADTRGTNGDAVPLSSAGLKRLADAIYSSYVAEWDLFRTDPEFVYSFIYDEAQHASETIPDLSGNAPTISDLLSRPSYVAWRFRYNAHNLSLDIGAWNLIREYFAELEELGSRGQLRRRQVISHVKLILDRERRSAFIRFACTVGVEPSLKSYVARVKSHADYGGAIIGVRNSLEAMTLSRGPTLRGALLRALRDSKLQPGGVEAMIKDMADGMSRASQEERENLSPILRDAWADVEMISDIIVALVGSVGDALDDDIWQTTREDQQYLDVARAGKRSEPIFRAAAIERFIKSVESLKSEVALKKIWTEIDNMSLKKEKIPLEKVLAFREVKPFWKPAPPRAPIVRYYVPAEPSTSRRSAQVFLLEPTGYLTPEELENLRIAQQSQSEVAEEDEEDEEDVHVVQSMHVRVERERPTTRPLRVVTPPLRKGPKVKTRGTPSAQARPVAPARPAVQVDITIWFYVGRRIYATFEHLFVPWSAPMDWTDFEKAITKGCGFSKVSTYGSQVMFFPQDSSNTPFYVHRPHSSEMNPALVRNLGKRLKSQYGWSLARFSPERQPPVAA